MSYTPERWQIIRLESKEGTHYRVFGTWGGSYLSGQSWRMNSGIVSMEEEKDFYAFTGSSGSVYYCHKRAYGSFGYGASVLSQMIEESKEKVSITILPEETNWKELNYENV